MSVTQKVTLYNNKFTVPPVINAVQNDTDRLIEAYFGDFTLQVGMTGVLSFIRSDRTHYEVSATLDTATNTATAELDQALTQAGVTQAQLKITDSGNVGSTFTFMINVQPDVAGISQQQDGWSVEEIMDDITSAATASGTSYDNTASGMTADDVQEALDELKTDVDGKQATLTAGDGIAISSDTISTDNDDTLTSAVKPAQAKAVGDALASIGETLKADFAPVITDTASGAIASFSDGADSYPLKECVVNIEAVQSGSGDPSPTNVRPITGWSEAKVTRTGKNLASATGVNNQVIGYVKAGVEYTFSLKNAGNVGFNLKQNTGTGAIIARQEASTASRLSVTFTPTESCSVYINGFNSFVDNASEFQLEVGSSYSDYEPYKGQTFTISLGDTRYGAVLDVTRGKLRVDMVQVTMNDTFGFMMAPNGIIYTPTLTPAPKQTETKTCICDTFNAIANVQNTSAMESAADQSICVQTASVYKRFLIKDTAHNSSIEAWNAFVAANPIKVVYELATPIEVDLTPTEITTLLGTNNIFADTGDVSIEYCADTKQWILKKIAEALV